MITVNTRKIFENVLDWIYPPVCVNCGKAGALLCDECLSKLPKVGKHFCSLCGKPLQPRHFCRHCGNAEFHFKASRAPYLYDGPVSVMIKKLKYSGMLGLVPLLSGLLADYWKELNWDPDLIVPVPLSKKRRGERGFNQSEMIGRDLSRRIGVRCDPRALMKQRDTVQQVGLDAAERRENLSGAFAAEPSLVREKQILLLDDVMTTGSTFSECTNVLLEAGAKSVSCLSVATTPVDHGKHKKLSF